MRTACDRGITPATWNPGYLIISTWSITENPEGQNILEPAGNTEAHHKESLSRILLLFTAQADPHLDGMSDSKRCTRYLSENQFEERLWLEDRSRWISSWPTNPECVSGLYPWYHSLPLCNSIAFDVLESILSSSSIAPSPFGNHEGEAGLTTEPRCNNIKLVWDARYAHFFFFFQSFWFVYWWYFHTRYLSIEIKYLFPGMGQATIVSGLHCSCTKTQSLIRCKDELDIGGTTGLSFESAVPNINCHLPADWGDETDEEVVLTSLARKNLGRTRWMANQ